MSEEKILSKENEEKVLLSKSDLQSICCAYVTIFLTAYEDLHLKYSEKEIAEVIRGSLSSYLDKYFNH